MTLKDVLTNKHPRFGDPLSEVFMGPSTTDTHSLSTRTVTEHPPTEGLGSYAEIVRARERPDPGRSLPRTSGPRASAALGTGLSSFKSGWETVSSPQGEDRRPSTDAGRRLAWVPEPLTPARGGAFSGWLAPEVGEGVLPLEPQ